MENKTTITVAATVRAPLKNVWNYWITPEHISQWNNASDDWHCPRSENDFRIGGKFLSRMEAKDGSVGFDFEGVYDEIREGRMIAYTMTDGRKVTTHFAEESYLTKVTETFEPESINPIEMQQAGWQAILDNFRKYVERADSSHFQKLHFSITINAPKEKVWKTMLEDASYRQWTSPFQEGAYYIGNWEKESEIRFLDPAGNGMVSRIAENRIYEFLSIEHLGSISNGVVDTESDAVKAFAGAHENYTFHESDGKTILEIDADTNDEYKAMFEEMWPKALSLLKALAAQ